MSWSAQVNSLNNTNMAYKITMLPPVIGGKYRVTITCGRDDDAWTPTQAEGILIEPLLGSGELPLIVFTYKMVAGLRSNSFELPMLHLGGKLREIRMETRLLADHAYAPLASNCDGGGDTTEIQDDM
jgi:hypothetical protein